MPADYLFDPPAQPYVPVKGQSATFPVRRIFCVGRNYAAHAHEMGHEVDRETPFYFTKASYAICHSGAEIAFPKGTEDCHHEMEFVVAIRKGGEEISEDQAMDHVFGYACGIDLTRRDLQAQAKDKRRPWDLGKDFDDAAVIAPLTPTETFGDIGDQRINLTLDGTVVQDAKLTELIWSIPELISHLSRFYRLEAGDLIYTGTPAGVGSINPGSVLEGQIDGLDPVVLRIAP